MKHQEIKKGDNVTRGYCSGQSTLACEGVFPSDSCEKPSNLASCAGASNLKTKAVAGNLCCGGGTLVAGASVSGTCGSSTSLCDQAGETLKK